MNTYGSIEVKVHDNRNLSYLHEVASGEGKRWPLALYQSIYPLNKKCLIQRFYR